MYYKNNIKRARALLYAQGCCCF